MTISDKTRKILWGRSGNRCSICKHEIVVDATQEDDESVIGDECHIISPHVGGPRHDTTFPKDQLDSYDNLILLCRIHHKMVDDQKDTYTTEILRQIKSNHEKWVTEKLDPSQIPRPLKRRRIKKNIPTYLHRLTTGKEVLSIVDGCCVYSFDHDELEIKEEVDLVSWFLQTVRDCLDLGADLEPSDQVRIGFELTQALKELEDAGFFVFGAREHQVLEGGVGGPSDWPAAILRVVRKTNDSISTVDLKDVKH